MKKIKKILSYIVLTYVAILIVGFIVVIGAFVYEVIEGPRMEKQKEAKMMFDFMRETAITDLSEAIEHYEGVPDWKDLGSVEANRKAFLERVHAIHGNYKWLTKDIPHTADDEGTKRLSFKIEGDTLHICDNRCCDFISADLYREYFREYIIDCKFKAVKVHEGKFGYYSIIPQSEQSRRAEELNDYYDEKYYGVKIPPKAH